MYGLMSLLADNVIHGSDKNLSGTTIASVVITGLVVVFIGLILLVFLYRFMESFLKGLTGVKKIRLRQLQKKRQKTSRRDLLRRFL